MLLALLGHFMRLTAISTLVRLSRLCQWLDAIIELAFEMVYLCCKVLVLALLSSRKIAQTVVLLFSSSRLLVVEGWTDYQHVVSASA